MNKEQKAVDQFDEWSESYDKGIWSRYFRNAYLRAIKLGETRLKKDGIDIMDIGCGTGGLIWEIDQRYAGRKIVGFDISPKMIEKAKMRPYRNDVCFKVGSANQLPFDEGVFDVVFCMNSFHHYLDQGRALSEIFRVLKKGGALILLDPIVDNPLRSSWSWILNHIFEEEDVIYHKKKDLVAMLSKAGFGEVKTRDYLYFTSFFFANKL